MAVAGEQGIATKRDIVAQHETLLQGCGLLDRSERGKLALTGSGAAEFLNGQVTNDIESLSDGEGCYAAFLNHKGKMLGDLRVLAVGGMDGTPLELLLDTERTALQALFDMIRRFKIGFDVDLSKRTLECGLISLIGPRSRDVAAAVLSDGKAAPQLPPNIEHAHVAAQIAGRQVRLITTAQPDGLDVLCDTQDVDEVRSALLAARATPVDERAVEVVRVEGGRPRYGVDLDDTVIPQEAGLNQRAVSFTKGCYVGQETVARLYYKGKPNRQLRGLRLSEPAPEGADLHLDGKLVGRLTSSLRSPTLGPIGLALLRREVAVGDSLSAGDRQAIAEVVELPFFADQMPHAPRRLT